MTTRRQFLTGLLATVAAPALPKIGLDTEVVSLTGKRGAPIVYSGLDDLYYMNVDSEYAAVYTPWFRPGGEIRGVLENVRAVTFFDDVKTGDTFMSTNMKFVETEMTVADVRRRELSYSNLYHRDPEFDQALDDYVRAHNGNSGEEEQGHVAGGEAVCDPVGQNKRRKTV